uniref:USP8 dimerisation domain-containing protein n=1 Tax=Meloidogyne javanica TaxID=6303 RepID=A0A915LD54_MELJA
MDSCKRLSDLVDQARARELPHSLTLEKCLQLLNEMHQMGVYYSSKCIDEERAFLFFLRFTSVVVEELPKHPCYASMSLTDKCILDSRTINAIISAEQLKRRIRNSRGDIERESAKSATAGNLDQQQVATTSRASSQNNNAGTAQELEHLLVPDQMLCPYVRCHLVSMQPIVFQRVIIPNNIPELFLSQIKPDSATNSGAFALLYGRLVSKSVIVSKLLPCSLDTIRNYRRFVPDPDSPDDIPIVGCICSSLTKACQAGFFRVCQISEMVCIVCPPGPNRTVLLHLVNMSPSGGASPANANCLTSSGVSVLPCPHQHITDSIVASIVRLENNAPTTITSLYQQQQNGIGSLSSIGVDVESNNVGLNPKGNNVLKISPKIEPPSDDIVALPGPEASIGGNINSNNGSNSAS